MKTDVFRLRLNGSGAGEEHSGAFRGSSAWNQALRYGAWGGLTPLLLAQKLAEVTNDVLVELGVLDQTDAREKLREFRADADALSLQGKTALHVVLDEAKLATGVRALQRLVNAHAWGVTPRIPPPEAFYRSYCEVRTVCRLTGSAIIDASSPCTLTTASLNPLAGEIVGAWLDHYFTQHRREPRHRFYSHVALTPAQWPAIFRAHCGG
ncbi:MAG: hypothetical protein JO015_14680 [Verrucomicrobia bacterium]|nr:hypothetical protein [Verrucomicrobiota bacterium]